MDNFLNLTIKVKKPIEAIQCANAFSLLQRKMYNVLLANAAGNLYPEMTHKISMKQLCNLMGYRSNDYKSIKQRFRELRRMDIEWDVINEKGNNVWTNTSPLSLARVIEGEGVCEYEFTASLIPFLDRPAQYAKISLFMQSKFKSSYGLALYENCERYRNMGLTKAFDIPTFKKLMGVSENQYPGFFALKRRVIITAINEVNKNADFNIEAEYEKLGCTVVSIKFLITNKPLAEETILPLQEKVNEDDLLITKLKSYFGLKEKEINKYFKNYEKKYIEEKINTILSSDSFKKGLIKNMAGYLKKALADNYQTNISSVHIIENEKRTLKSYAQATQQCDDKLRDLKRAHDYYLSGEVRKLLPTLAQDVKEAVLAAFEEHLGKSLYFDIYRKEGIANVLIADRFVEFAKINCPKLLNSLMSFDEYLLKLGTVPI